MAELHLIPVDIGREPPSWAMTISGSGQDG
jgi:hypothetical protein